MKKTHFITLILGFCLSLSLFSCKKDDEAEPTNFLEFEGSNSPLEKGFFALASQNSTQNEYLVWLTSKEVSYNSEVCFKPLGTFLIARIFVDKTKGELATGTYSINASNHIYCDKNLRLTEEGYVTDAEFDSPVATGVSGTIVVEKAGDNYTFNINITYTGSEGQTKTIKANYKGTLEEIDLCD